MKRFFKVTAFILSLALTVLFLQNMVLIPWDAQDVQVSGFYSEPERSLDVVFTGASDMYTSFSPCGAYDKYGFTSYLYCVPRNTVAFWKPQVEEILLTQSPELIVIEVNGALYTDEDNLCTDENLHLFTDHIPSLKRRGRFVRETLSESDKPEYLFPYIKYHGNLSSLKSAALVFSDRLGFLLRGGLIMHGERAHFGHMKPKGKEPDLSELTGTLPVEEAYEERLRSFLSWAKEEVSCPILFLRTPHYLAEGENIQQEFFRRANRVEEIVSEYGYPMLQCDRIHKEIGLDASTDYFDPEHLNMQGQLKFTDYLGNILVKDYAVYPGELSDKDRQRWDDGVTMFNIYVQKGSAMTKEERAAMGRSLEYESGALKKLLSSP